MADYQYVLSSSFSNGVNLLCLHNTIVDFGFVNPFNGITLDNGIVIINFTGALSPADQISLNSIITDHNPDLCEQISDIGYVIGSAGEAESLTLSSTTSSTPQQKLRMIMEDLPTGRYRIGWYYEWYQSSQATDFRARIQLNDSIDLMSHSQELAQSGSTQSLVISGFAYRDLSEGNHFVDLDFWAEGNTSYIKNVRLEIWKAS